MKVIKQLPAAAVFDPSARRDVILPAAGERQNALRKGEDKGENAAQMARGAQKSGSFNLQLNQQLSSMQSADSYLGDLQDRLGGLKLNLSRELSAPQSQDREGVRQATRQVNELLEQRAQRSDGSLDAKFRLRLNEPVRSRFSLEGLESVDAIQRSGKETLLFSAGRQLAEPAAVVLDDGMSTEQVLRRFNATLGQAGIRAELDSDGALKFSAPEADWQQLKGQLAVQGEGKLFAKGKNTRLKSQEEGLLAFPTEIRTDAFREQRQLLDSVVSALDRIGGLRDQLRHRQDDIRDFLDRHASEDEREWAHSFAASMLDRMGRSATHYSAAAQTVVAQANLSRFAVVSLLA